MLFLEVWFFENASLFYYHSRITNFCFRKDFRTWKKYFRKFDITPSACLVSNIIFKLNVVCTIVHTSQDSINEIIEYLLRNQKLRYGIHDSYNEIWNVVSQCQVSSYRIFRIFWVSTIPVVVFAGTSRSVWSIFLERTFLIFSKTSLWWSCFVLSNFRTRSYYPIVFGCNFAPVFFGYDLTYLKKFYRPFTII